MRVAYWLNKVTRARAYAHAHDPWHPYTHTHTHTDPRREISNSFLLCHGKSRYANAPHCYVPSYYRPWRPLRKNRGIALLFFVNLGILDGDGWSTIRPGRLYPGKDPIPIVQEAGWASEPVWIGAANLAPIGIRSPDFRARSESLYRLSHPGSFLSFIFTWRHALCSRLLGHEVTFWTRLCHAGRLHSTERWSI